MSYSYTRISTFTITHARYLSSKVAADMHLCSIYYGQPSEARVRDYSEELAILLRDGYVEAYEFGYKRSGQRIVSWRYTVARNGGITADDSPGKLVSTADVSGAAFFNFLTHSIEWYELNQSERDRIEASLPVKRTAGTLPEDGQGYWRSDNTYSSEGVWMPRKTFVPLS